MNSQMSWRLGSYKYPFYQGRLNVLFETNVVDSHLFLDAGCGLEGRYFSNLPLDTWGIGLDIDRENVAKCKRANASKNVSFVVGDIQNLPFMTCTFDMIVCCDVLEHVREPDKAVEELASSLRKGGQLLVTTTNLFNPAMLIDCLLPNVISQKIIKNLGGPSHYVRVRRFSSCSLLKKLRNCGFSVSLLMFGYPPIGKPWLYEFHNIEPPKIFNIWIIFDKLTNIKPLQKFKEVILAIARK